MEYKLTERELDVMFAVAEHGSGAMAGRALGISEQTVKNHLSALIRKTGATSTLQAYHRLMGGQRLRKVTSTVTTIEYEEIE
jgi:DNA-binding NarL/FixJ family response regulator